MLVFGDAADFMLFLLLEFVLVLIFVFLFVFVFVFIWYKIYINPTFTFDNDDSCEEFDIYDFSIVLK